MLFRSNFLSKAFHLKPGTIEWDGEVTQFISACQHMEFLKAESFRLETLHKSKETEPTEKETSLKFDHASSTDTAIYNTCKSVRDAVQNFTPNLELIPLIINGDTVHTDDQRPGFDPSSPFLPKYRTSLATKSMLEQALTCADTQITNWHRQPINNRIDSLKKVAKLIEEKRLSLTAALIMDAGKPFSEADAEL